MQRQYIAIDLKSFYASVECVERGLDPLTARLAVADISRTDKTICLAVSPALKKYGLRGRERLYHVIQVAERAGVDFTVAPPQMRKYMDISRHIYQIYAKFVAPTDIHVYSIDEVFIDATSYLATYHATARQLAEKIIYAVLKETGITATAGIGSNLYLAKVAMDIKAKHMPADSRGVRIAELTERTYREELWNHTPLTDFWRIGPGYSRRLARLGIHTMGDLARYSLTGSHKLYAEFGVNAELLIDHAWGWEPVTMQDIKSYHTDNHSLSSGQVLHEPYTYDDAKLVTWEMADALALELFAKHLVADQIVLTICYDKDCPGYHGPTHTDHYGRTVPKPAHGTMRLDRPTNSAKTFASKATELYDSIVDTTLNVRAIYVVAGHVQAAGKASGELRQGSLFADYTAEAAATARDQRLQAAELAIKQRYGKNSIMKLKNYEPRATMRIRNRQVGGHRA